MPGVRSKAMGKLCASWKVLYVKFASYHLYTLSFTSHSFFFFSFFITWYIYRFHLFCILFCSFFSIITSLHSSICYIFPYCRNSQQQKHHKYATKLCSEGDAHFSFSVYIEREKEKAPAKSTFCPVIYSQKPAFICLYNLVVNCAHGRFNNNNINNIVPLTLQNILYYLLQCIPLKPSFGLINIHILILYTYIHILTITKDFCTIYFCS